MVVPDSPPHQKISSESPIVHTPKTKRVACRIEPEKQVVASPSNVGTPRSKTEEPITVGPQRLPDSPFPKKVTPYRRVDSPGGEIVSETTILDRTDDLFEIDSESERTLTEEPKTPKFQIIRSEMPEGIPKRRLAPVVLPFDSDTGKGPKSKIKSQVNLKKPEMNPRKGPEEKLKEGDKPHVIPDPGTSVLPCEKAAKVPIVRSPSKHLSESLVGTLSSHSTPPSSPTSHLVLLVEPVAMGMVEEIENALIESNRVAAMLIPQFYGKKGEKPEDHIMKVEDYFQNYNIRDQEQKCNRIRDTCCGKARTWLSTLTEYPKMFDPEEAPGEAVKAKTMKSMF